MSAIDLYLYDLQEGNVNFEFITEGDESKVKSLLSKATSVFKKLSPEEKEKGKLKIKEAQNDPKYLKIKNVMKKHADLIKTSGSFNSGKFAKDLGEVAGYSVGQLGKFVGGAFFLLMMSPELTVRIFTTGLIPIDIFSLLVVFLADLPAPVITKLVTKTNKSIGNIANEINKNKVIKPLNFIIAIVSFIILVMPIMGTVSAITVIYASMSLICLTLLKIALSVYIGIKTNSWKSFEDRLKTAKHFSENKKFKNDSYVNSLLFISSLRESLCHQTLNKKHKSFLLYEATDYEILFLSVEGTFPENKNGNCDVLLSIYSGLYNVNLEYSDIPTNGVYGSILTELFISEFNNLSVLLEGKIDPSKLESLKKIVDAARDTVKANHPDSHPNFNSYSDAEKERLNRATEKATTDFKHAKERFNTYKNTGTDIGSKPNPKQTQNNQRSSSSNRRSYQSQYASSWWYNFAAKYQTIDVKNFANVFTKVPGASKLASIMNSSTALAGSLVAIGGAAVAALLAVASFKLYQRYLSKEAKQCTGTSYKERSMCILSNQIKATEERIKDLRSSVYLCDVITKQKSNRRANAEERNSCKQSISGILDSLTDDLSKMKTKYARY